MTVSLSDLSSFNEVLADKLIKAPTTYLPLVSVTIYLYVIRAALHDSTAVKHCLVYNRIYPKFFSKIYYLGLIN